MRSTSAYVIQNPDNQLFLNTITIRKTDCIKKFMESVKDKNDLWRKYLAAGWSCTRIKISIA
jgi:hypothetical protein